MKETLRLSLRWTLVVTAMTLAGCATPPPIDPAALPQTPAAFKETGSSPLRFKVVPATMAPDGGWYNVFSDPVLADLIARADRSNTSIQVSAARLVQARALLLQANAQRLPQVNAGAQVQRGDGFTVTNLPAGNPLTLYSLGANVSWEADLFGRLRRASEAASLDAKASEALLRNTRLVIEADVAQAYLALRALDEERDIVRRTADAFRGTLDLTERRYRAGDVAELDVARATTQVASTEADALGLDRRRAELEHAIAVLVGEVPSDFSIAPASWTTALPAIPAGLPAEVLARRPDVAAAQASMLAAQARVGVAKAAWFPDISLTGSGGVASPQLSDLFKWSARAWGIGALASLPIFDGGRRESGIRFAGGEMDAAIAQYREQVLVAFRDVEDQLSALRLLEQQSEAQARAVNAATRATTLSERRWREGLVSQLDLLDAQRSELADRRAAVEVKSAQYQATVGLVRALGGGWESHT
ncbi:MAG TPA: efflux transporter outer membrane subunit [Usitatibacter sp.]|jgi:multidrug efflux system outer membrane protein|nr:efflux transporter outer membrane subunit [Usitatibacter sp.]